MTQRSIGLWMTLVAAVLFAVSAVAAADVFESVEPVRVAQFRSIFAALILVAVAFRRNALSHGGRIGGLMLLGGNLAAVTITFYWAIERLGVGNHHPVHRPGPRDGLDAPRRKEERASAAAWPAPA